MQLGHAREDYLRWLLATRDLSPHTIRAYSCDLVACERHFGAHTVLSRIDRDGLIDFVEAQRAAGLSPTSIRRRASGLRGFWRWSVSSGLVDTDPWLGVSIATARSRRLPRLLPTHDLKRLLRSLMWAADVHDEPDRRGVLERPYESTTLLAVALMVGTGVRVNEVVGIRCHDLDLPGQTLRILGKGRRERQVFLTDEWISGLARAYLKTRAALRVEHPHLLFNSRCDPLTATAMRHRLIKAAREAGLGTRVTPHVLRHTAATQLIEADVDIRYIQRLLGHASLKTTEIYTHVSDLALRRVVTKADVLGRLVEQR